MGSLNFIFYFVNDPWDVIRNCPLKSLPSVAVLVVVNVKLSNQLLSLGGIFIHFLLCKIVKVVIVDFDLVCVLGIGIVIDLNFLNGIQTS